MSRPCCLPVKKPSVSPCTRKPQDQLCSQTTNSAACPKTAWGVLGVRPMGVRPTCGQFNGGFGVKESRRWEKKEMKRKPYQKNAKIWVVLEQIQITRIIFLYKFDCFRSTNCFQSTDFQISGCGYKCREHWKLGQLPKSLLNYLQWHCPKGNDKNCQDREHLSSLDHLRFWRSLIPDHSVRLRFTTSKLSSPPQGARLRDPKGNSDFFCEFQFDSFII